MREVTLPSELGELAPGHWLAMDAQVVGGAGQFWLQPVVGLCVKCIYVFEGERSADAVLALACK